jgi:hypothetical protein
MDDPIAKKTMRDIATSYERLATLAEVKQSKSASSLLGVGDVTGAS